ncbi:hypothetical protein, partial [Yersinia pestis]
FTPLPILTVQDRVIGVCQQSERSFGSFEVIEKAIFSLVSEGLTAPRGAPVAYATYILTPVVISYRHTETERVSSKRR